MTLRDEIAAELADAWEPYDVVADNILSLVLAHATSREARERFQAAYNGHAGSFKDALNAGIKAALEVES